MTDHPDIVERLLTCSRREFPRDASEAAKRIERDAAEITRLRAEAEALRKALEWYSQRAVPAFHPDSPGHCDDGYFARKTLAAIAATKEQQA